MEHYKLEDVDYKIDWKQTLLRNLFWIPQFALMIVAVVQGNKFLTAITDQSLRAAIAVALIFAFLQILRMVGAPELILREVRTVQKRKKV